MEASALRAPAGLTRLSLPSALLRLRTDDQLVTLFRAGNEDAFRVIHDRYRQRLFAYVRQMLAGSRSDAEDALQDVFLRAYGALRADDRPVALKAWLYRVAHNRCVDQLRRPIPAPSDVFDLSRTPIHDPLAEVERRDDLRRLVADVQRLPDQQRSALLMRELEGLTYIELAEALEVSVPAVKSLLVRARIGLVEQAEARDAACADIRGDIALSFGKGVRASARARRHLRDCQGCREYRTEMRSVRQGIHSLTPGGSGPLGLLAKILGIGGAGGGAAAGAGGGAVGGGAVVVGGGAAAATTAKVAAIVCCAAITAGGAVEIKERTAQQRGKRDAQQTRPSGTAIPAERTLAPTPLAGQDGPGLSVRPRGAAARAAGGSATAERGARTTRGAAVEEEPISPHTEVEPLVPSGAAMEGSPTGGTAAPADEAATVTTAPATAEEPADEPLATTVLQQGASSDGQTTTSGTSSTSPQAGTASTDGSGGSSTSGGSSSTTSSSGG